MTGSAEPTLKDLVRDIDKSWPFILCGALAGLLLAFIFFSVSVPHYRAQILVGPTSETATADITAMLGQFDLPNLQYIVRRPGPSEAADFVRFENILTGPAVSSILAGNRDIIEGVEKDRSYVFSIAAGTATAEQLSEYLSRKVKILPVGSTYLRKIRYYHPDPEFAVMLLSSLREAADEMIRGEVRAQTDRRIAYINAQLAKTVNPAHREALVSILMEQEQVRMMVNMDEPFAASVAEPPSPTSKPHWPQRSLFYPVFIMIGVIAGYLVYALRSQGQNSSP